MKNEHVILKSASSRVTLSVAKGLAFLFALMLSLTACSDYEADYEDMYGYMVDATTIIPGSSSSVVLSESEGSSSSIASSSSVKSSSSVASSSSVKSSSSVASSSSSSKIILSSSSEETSIKYGSLTDSRDGRVYKTVTIGTQTWMAENLNYSTSGSYCYGNNASNCDKYGRLYVWSAAMNACPSGWHLPDDDEWNTLWTAVGGTGTAGTKLKSKSGWYNNGNGTDSFGFAVLPAGYRGDYGIFDYEGSYARFWSSTESGSNVAYGWYFYCSFDHVGRNNHNKNNGFSVRCLRDSDEGSEATSSSSQAQPSSSSSNVIPGFDPESSSSIASSSSVKSSSSVASSSSAKSSSSVVSSSSVNDGYDAVAQTLTDSRDNQVYKTVTIGTQTWMAENLNYNYNNGTAKSYCYNNESSNCTKYGRLYLWSAAMDSAAVFSTAGKGCGYGKTCNPSGTVQGICPEGWHLPSRDEWNALFTAVGGSAGTMLKSTSGWISSGNGTDAYGFSALPAGLYDSDYGNFNYVGYSAYFWSSTESEYDSRDAYYMYLYYARAYVDLDYYNKYYARSVRCLKD